MIMEKCCGGIIFKSEKDTKYLLLKHKEEGGGHWDFPKGHVEKGESEKETALREIYEETGLRVKIFWEFRESVSYFDNINKVGKVVVFFLCEANSLKVNLAVDEVEDYTWLEFNEALSKLTHDNAKNLLKKANEFVKKIV